MEAQTPITIEYKENNERQAYPSDQKKYQILTNEKNYSLIIKLYENTNIQLIIRPNEEPPIVNIKNC